RQPRLAVDDPEALVGHAEPGHIAGAVAAATHRAVAVRAEERRQLDLEADRAAETAAGDGDGWHAGALGRTRARVGRGLEAGLLPHLELLHAAEVHAIRLRAELQDDVDWLRIRADTVAELRALPHHHHGMGLALHDGAADRPVRERGILVDVTLALPRLADQLPASRGEGVGVVAGLHAARVAARAGAHAEAPTEDGRVVGAPASGSEVDRRVVGGGHELPLARVCGVVLQEELLPGDREIRAGGHRRRGGSQRAGGRLNGAGGRRQRRARAVVR